MAQDFGFGDLEKSYKGVIETLEAEFGFIKPTERLPGKYAAGEVFFSVYSIDKVGICVGDEVEFFLNPDRKREPEALEVWVTGRSQQEVPLREKGSAEDVPVTHRAWQEGVTGSLAQKSVGITAQKPVSRHIQGKISRVLPNGAGFIEPSDKVDGVGEVFFLTKWVRSGGMELCPGDLLEFVPDVNKKDPSKLTAFQIRLVQCKPRSQDHIESFIRKALRKIRDEPEHETTFLLEMVSSKATWECVGRCWAISSEALEQLLDLLELLQMRCKGLQQNFTEMLRGFLRGEIFTSQNSTFGQFIQIAFAEGFKDRQKKSRCFLRMVLDRLPECGRLVARLIKPMLCQEEGSTEHFLYSIVKELTLLNCESVSDFHWDELPVVPSPQEIFGGPLETDIYLNPVVTRGPYGSVEEYLNTNFRLLRADCFYALKNIVQDYIHDRLDAEETHVYKSVRLRDVRVIDYRNGIVLALQVTPLVPIDDWESCMNLMFGNLLCLSPSRSFKDRIWATVVEKDPVLLSEEGIILVELCTVINSKDDATCISKLHECSGHTVMVESPTYYNAYRPVMKAIQELDGKTMPFTRELVHLSEPCRPEHIDPHVDIENQQELDESQKVAFELCLKQRVAIVQGPPGTGKTYLAIQLVKHFLSHGKMTEPIFIISRKNRALDEMLKILHHLFPDDVVRVGGRSEERSLDRCNLIELKRKTARSLTNRRAKGEVATAAEAVKMEVEKLCRDLQSSTYFSAKTLLNVFNVSQIETLVLGSGFRSVPTEQWRRIKAILDEEAHPEKLKMLSEDEVDLLSNVLLQWVPPPDTFESLVKNEAILAQYINLQPHATSEGAAVKKRDTYELLEGRDVKDEERERIKNEGTNFIKLKTGVCIVFDSKEENPQMPRISPAAEKLAEEFPVDALRRIRDLWELTPHDRAVVIQIALWSEKSTIEKKLNVALARYKDLLKQKQEMDHEHNVMSMGTKKIVGMTLTGASIHRYIMEALTPAIIIVEEAAEVMEAELLPLLRAWVKHLILIGDHKQLRPLVHSTVLAHEYHLDVSLVERLTSNAYPYAALQIQSRMREEIAYLLRDVYPELKNNHAKVDKNEAPNFLPSVFFWSHNDGEQGRFTFSNPKEARRAVFLAFLFLQQGYRPEDVTILTTYRGQMNLIKAILRDTQNEASIPLGPHVDFKCLDPAETLEERLKVKTIDSYQGHENEIVIVSLVRSNPSSELGFVGSLNRRCVAQSRSRCGLYFVGNVNCLLKAKDSCWASLIGKLSATEHVGERIPLKCPVHKDGVTEARTAEDIPLDGICKRPCEENMECIVHKCDKNCQPFHTHTQEECQRPHRFQQSQCSHYSERKCNQPVSSIKCNQPCEKMMGCGQHQCPAPCGSEHNHRASECNVPVPFVHTVCKHPSRRRCGDDPTTSKCKKIIEFAFENCGHPGARECWQSERDILCMKGCPRMLSCGHPCSALCGEDCSNLSCPFCELNVHVY